MGQLTPEDFLRMQREAKARVTEMQKRSRFYTAQSQREPATQRGGEPENRPVAPQSAEDKTECENVLHIPAGTKRPTAGNDDQAELLFLMILLLLIGEEDRDMFFLLMMIIME